MAERAVNKLLARFPSASRARLLAEAETVDMEARHMVFDSGQPIQHVYFPLDAVVSLVLPLDDAIVEVATIGHEGVVGLPVFLGAESVPGRAFAQVPGRALRVSAGVFRAESRSDRTAEVLMLYTQALLNQIAQTAACNRAHGLHVRCARWLLMTHDRAQRDAFPMTQEFLAQMLGVRRPTVNEAATALQDEGLIRYTRGQLAIVDRGGLEKKSCECYEKVRVEYARLVS